MQTSQIWTWIWNLLDYEELENLKEECTVQMTLLELNMAHTKQLEQIVEIIEENELELD